jgi:hypothetical protein
MLKDLFVGMPAPGKGPLERPKASLELSPYYLSLKENSPVRFQQCAKWTSNPAKNTWHYFSQLCKSVKQGGYQAQKGGDPASVYFDGQHWQIHNGHHRLAICRYLYGPHAKIVFRKPAGNGLQYVTPVLKISK